MAIASEFDELENEFRRAGALAALDYLVDELRRQERFHELYEALKLRARNKLGLSLNPAVEEISEQKKQLLEDALVAACREVGTLLMRKGHVRDGWIYFRPVGDRAEAAKILSELPVSHDNVDELVQVLLSEGVDPNHGFDLALQFFGTCQSITLFDQEIVRHPLPVQRHAAGRLVAKIHEDLLASLQADIQRQVAAMPHSPTIAGLIADRDWLFENNAYHIDTTHLAAVVRFAKVIVDPTVLELALDLTAYGSKLGAQFHYASEEPFGQLYEDHRIFFQTLLQRDVEQGLEHFRLKAETLDPAEFGTAPVEVYVDLLARTGRHKESLLAAVRLFPVNMRSIGIAPTLLELAKSSGEFGPLFDYCRARNDLLGFAAGLVEQQQAK